MRRWLAIWIDLVRERFFDEDERRMRKTIRWEEKYRKK